MMGEATPTAGPYLAEKLLTFDERLSAVLPRVLTSHDDEAVHDLRVTLRRTRTLLEMGRSVLGPFHADEVRRALRNVQRATGALRDEEVLLELMTSLRREDARIAAWLESRRRRERRLRGALVRMVRTGEVDRARRLLQALLAFRVKPSRDRKLAKFSRECVTIARRRVDRRLAAGVDDPQQLHCLRIAYKRLRYAVEAFSETLPEELVVLAQQAARMQKRLGAVHDVDIVLGCVRRARLLGPEARDEVFASLEALRGTRLAHSMSALAQEPRAPSIPSDHGPGLAAAHASGVESLRKTSTR